MHLVIYKHKYDKLWQRQCKSLHDAKENNLMKKKKMIKIKSNQIWSRKTVVTQIFY